MFIQADDCIATYALQCTKPTVHHCTATQQWTVAYVATIATVAIVATVATMANQPS